jgi:hypothetical protein
MHFYFSLQYSAIQAAVLRHGRLWSMAGISLALAELNEITLPEIAHKHGGVVLVAGGGKFTARFSNETNAKHAGTEIVKAVAATFPMLEYQYSDRPYQAATLNEALNLNEDAGLVAELNEKKRNFRGGGLSFNPHFKLCDECGTYPAATETHLAKTKADLCTYCDAAKSSASIEVASILNKDEKMLTTIERIYRKYFKDAGISPDRKIPLDFSDMVSPYDKDAETGVDKARGRMAVWFSDINNMNDKVPIWINQEEDKIIPTFQRVTEVYVNTTTNALTKTFEDTSQPYLPFRIIIAGGDDLCLVMAEKYVIDFTRNLSAALNNEIEAVNQQPDHPLNYEWLKNRKSDYDRKTGSDTVSQPPKPYSFGAAFIVTAIHTPFAHIHAVGETLMSTAKSETDRQANSINWRIMAEENAVSDVVLKFERPLFIDSLPEAPDSSRMTFQDYVTQCDNLNTVSGSHRFQVISKMIDCRDNPAELTRQLQILDSAETGKSFATLFNPPFYDDDRLNAGRIATAFELMSIERR